MALRLKNTLVLALPRGGVVTGYEVARRIKADLDIVTPRKLPSPDNPELALGAVMPDGSIFLNKQIVAFNQVPDDYIEREKKREMAESLRRLSTYRGERAYPVIKGKTVILVDDGVATGATMIAAARWVRKQGPARIIIAVPVIPEETLDLLKNEADDIVYLDIPEFFYAIGQFYKEFEQVEDPEVIKLLNEYWQGQS